jgi:hypothetical protein
MSGEMILASADEKKNVERQILRGYLGAGVSFSVILGILPGAIIGHECGNSFTVLFSVIASFLIVGTGISGICAACGIRNYRQELAALGDAKQIVYKLLAMRSETDGQIVDLEIRRHKIDRELAALTSDEFVEEFVRDRPFPSAPELPPAPQPSPQDVSEEPDDDFRWRLDSDCA